MNEMHAPDKTIDSPRGRPGARVVALAFVALLLAGCATAGREFSESEVRNIRIGQTTQVQVRSMFGPPWRTGLENGQETWTYGAYRYSILAPESSSDLKIRFDANGVVASYAYSTTVHDK
jgi:outer membrane protein assembly factor BamE (lipoprotein component of BamABCDE complex)